MIESQKHSFHLVDPSPWLLMSTSLGALAVAVGIMMDMHSFQGSATLLSLGLIFLLYSMFVWCRDVLRGSTLEGHHTKAVFRYSWIMFIVSEVIFFFAFFWAFFYVGGPWQFGFQDAATPIMQGIIDLHDDIFFFLILILVCVLWTLVRALWLWHKNEKTNPIPQRIVHGTTIEIIWTIFASIILMFIAIPSFALLYSMDEVVVDPAVTIGEPRYRTYNFGHFTSSNICGTHHDYIPLYKEGITLENYGSWLSKFFTVAHCSGREGSLESTAGSSQQPATVNNPNAALVSYADTIRSGLQRDILNAMSIRVQRQLQANGVLELYQQNGVRLHGDPQALIKGVAKQVISGLDFDEERNLADLQRFLTRLQTDHHWRDLEKVIHRTIWPRTPFG